MKVFVVGDSINYANFIKEAELTDKLEDAKVVLFTGGEDVDPSMYGKEKYYLTYSNLERDLKEKEIFERVKPNQLCVGICRGSQLLCCLNGGILVQDCSNHAIGRTHSITNGDVEYEITSTHHQMQYPYKLDPKDYDLLYTTPEPRSNYYDGDGINRDTILENGEPEIVLYHKKGLPKCLAIQGHPEMMPNSAVSKMLDELIKTLVDEIK